MRPIFSRFFACILVATLTLALALISGVAGAQQELKIATLSPEGTSLTAAFRAAGQEIKTATEGRVVLKIYPGGVMGSDPQVMRKMRVGQLSGGFLTAGSIGQLDPDYALLSMPMLLTTFAQVDAARAAVEDKLVAGLGRKGLVSTGIVEIGFVYLMGNQPIASREDMFKAKPWIPEGNKIGQEIFEAFGVTPIPLPVPDVITGLQTGIIDTVISSPVAAVALQWFTRVSHLTDTPLLYSYGSLVFDRKALGRLGKEDSKLALDILTRHMAGVDAGSRKGNADALDALKAQAVTFVPVNEAERAELKAVCDELIEQRRADGVLDATLLDAVRKAAGAAGAQ